MTPWYTGVGPGVSDGLRLSFVGAVGEAGAAERQARPRPQEPGPRAAAPRCWRHWRLGAGAKWPAPIGMASASEEGVRTGHETARGGTDVASRAPQEGHPEREEGGTARGSEVPREEGQGRGLGVQTGQEPAPCGWVWGHT